MDEDIELCQATAGFLRQSPHAAALGEIRRDVLVPLRRVQARQRQAESFLVPAVQGHVGAVGA
jgi:hypothetical protein